MTDTVYPSILHRLLAEMDALTAEQLVAAETKERVARSEKEIGEPLPQSLRAMWALYRSKAERRNELAEQHNAMHDQDVDPDTAEHQKIHEEIRALEKEAKILGESFWGSVKEQYQSDPDGNGIGLRAGWVIVDMYGGKSAGPLGKLFEFIFAD